MPYTVVPHLVCGSTVSDFCIDKISVDVVADVIFISVPTMPGRCLPCGSTAWGHGSTVPAVLPHPVRTDLVWSWLCRTHDSTASPRGSIAGPCGSIAPVVLYLRGSWAEWWVTVGIVPPLYKGVFFSKKTYLFHPQTPLLLQAPFSPDLSP